MINRDNWKCDRCLKNDEHAACCLCPLRGGPLKPTTCNQWVHLTCALILPNIKIEFDYNMQPVDISGIQAFRSSDRAVSIIKANSIESINYFITDVHILH